MIPAVSAPTIPSGLPTAKASSPTRKVLESPMDAAGKPLACSARTAKSRWESLTVTGASKARPSASMTVADGARATWALVIIVPVDRQITPAPPPGWCPRTCTVNWRRRSAIISSSPSRGVDPFGISGAMLASLPGSLGSLADHDHPFSEQTSAYNGSANGGPYPLWSEQGLYIGGVADRHAIQGHQHITDKQASSFGGTVGLHSHNDDTARPRQIQS